MIFEELNRPFLLASNSIHITKSFIDKKAISEREFFIISPLYEVFTLRNQGV
jgi:hypothetical protein